jgi:HAD superfamily hydrolase (TIGR01509 family)
MTATIAQMTEHRQPHSAAQQALKLSAVIFDVDGVLLASPHEHAWRDALENAADRTRFTTDMYQSQVAGKPRLAGALAGLLALRLSHTAADAEKYAERKQRRLEELIRQGAVSAFPDALRFVRAINRLRWPMAVASSSKNANEMMKRIPLDAFHTLLNVFESNVCGRDLKQGKPNPEIFLLAAEELPMAAASCLVVEDAPAGIEAACAAGMTALGVARLNDAQPLWDAGARLVVTSLDWVSIPELAIGKLRRRTP